MNVIIPRKRTDGGTSFNKLVAYISSREARPGTDDLLTDDSHVPVSEAKAAVFDRLVEYIDRSEPGDMAVSSIEELPDGRQRLKVGDVSCETNCFSWETAAAEMNMIAAQNTRCEDPVYHFILSWRENELPTDAQIFECAQHCIKALGMDGHQYVTAIHQDTDNTHCHVAVNRINPVDFRATNMWNDADELQKACRILERKYGFEQDNGSWTWGVNDQLVRVRSGFERAPQGTVQRETYSDKESLFHYAVRTVRDDVDQAIGQGVAEWDHLHLLLHTKGLGLREQGQGLVVYDALNPEGPVVKASSVHPYMTKPELEPIYGSFIPSVGQPGGEAMSAKADVIEVYVSDFQVRDRGDRFDRRMARAEARKDLKARYKHYRANWVKPDLKYRERMQAIAQQAKSMKELVRSTYDDPLMRKLMYRVAEFERMKASAALRVQIRAERQVLFESGQLKPLSYRPWVEQQALAGDVAAVSQLRGFSYREKRMANRASFQIEGAIQLARADDTPMFDRPFHASQIRRDGTIEYLRYGQVGVIDHGDQLQIMKGFDAHDDAANKRLAVGLVSTKSGEQVVIDGSDGFVNSMLMITSQFNERFSGSPVVPTDSNQRNLLENFGSAYSQTSDMVDQHRSVVESGPDLYEQANDDFNKPRF